MKDLNGFYLIDLNGFHPLNLCIRQEKSLYKFNNLYFSHFSVEFFIKKLVLYILFFSKNTSIDLLKFSQRNKTLIGD